jgi:hypothetical protein
MAETKPRKFWQFHLSTAVLISITTGALMWANYRDAECNEPDSDYADYDGIQHRVSCKRSGWPVVYTQLYVDGHRLNEIKTTVIPLINLALGMAVLTAIAHFSERRIRHREAKNQ